MTIPIFGPFPSFYIVKNSTDEDQSHHDSTRQKRGPKHLSLSRENGVLRVHLAQVPRVLPERRVKCIQSPRPRFYTLQQGDR